MVRAICAILGAVFTGAATLFLFPLLAGSTWMSAGELRKFGFTFLGLALIAGLFWYRAGLGRRDDWPRS